MKQTAIVPGSLGAIARQENKSIAETFVDANCIVIVDASGSMDTRDSRGGRSRYDVAREELAILQNNLPGKIAVVAFSNEVLFCPNGIVPYLGGGTDLARALQFVQVADVPGIRFVLISDGEPNDKHKALEIARRFKNRIDVIYVGPEDKPYGRDFLQQLAMATGGETVTADRAKELAAGVRQLLEKNYDHDPH